MVRRRLQTSYQNASAEVMHNYFQNHQEKEFLCEEEGVCKSIGSSERPVSAIWQHYSHIGLLKNLQGFDTIMEQILH